jgi:hypothetical protein
VQHTLRLRVVWRIGYFKTVDGYPRIVPTSSATAAMICMDATYQLWSAQQRYGSRLHERDHWISSLRITTYLSSLKSFWHFLNLSSIYHCTPKLLVYKARRICPSLGPRTLVHVSPSLPLDRILALASCRNTMSSYYFSFPTQPHSVGT